MKNVVSLHCVSKYMFNPQNVTSMIKYVLKQNNNSASAAFGKWYAYPVVEETMDLEDLAHHMEEHNTGFSEAMCVGVMKAMVKCIKEQLLAGKNVKIDNLAIFSVGIRNREGAASESDFTITNNIGGVKLRARATGTLSNANLNLAATLKKASALMGSGSNGGSTPDNGGSNTPSGGGSTPSSGPATSIDGISITSISNKTDGQSISESNNPVFSIKGTGIDSLTADNFVMSDGKKGVFIANSATSGSLSFYDNALTEGQQTLKVMVGSQCIFTLNVEVENRVEF